MTEKELEAILSNAHGIGLHAGVHSILTEEFTPGIIQVIYRDNNLNDGVRMFKYISGELSSFNKRVLIKHTSDNSFDFTLIVEKEPAIVLNIYNVEIPKDRMEWFLEKEPQNRPLSMVFTRYPSIHTLEGTANYSEILLDTDLQPIHIHSWKGLPLGTSSGDSTIT